MSITIISAQDTQLRCLEGAVLVDIRQSDEHCREHISAILFRSKFLYAPFF